jgi:hypothetical protein
MSSAESSERRATHRIIAEAPGIERSGDGWQARLRGEEHDSLRPYLPLSTETIERRQSQYDVMCSNRQSYLSAQARLYAGGISFNKVCSSLREPFLPADSQ